MKVFAIGDLHLSFGENVDKPMDIYGDAWKDYEQRLAESWCALVSPEDLVIIPGDISWGMHLEDAMADLAWVDALPGKKLLLRGNHDLWWSSMAKMRGLFGSIEFIQNDAYLGDGFAVIGSRGWLCPEDSAFSEATDRKVYDRECMRLSMSLSDLHARCRQQGIASDDLFIIGAMHFPPCSDKQHPSKFTDFFASAGAGLVVYGHLHGAMAFRNAPEGSLQKVEYRLCSLDKLNCIPRLLWESPRQ